MPDPARRVTFLRRLASTLALWTFTLGALLSGSEWAMGLLVIIITTVGLIEYFALVRHRQIRPLPIFGLTCGLTLVLGVFLETRLHGSAAASHTETFLLAAVLLSLCAMLVFTRRDPAELMESGIHTLFGVLYVAWMLTFLLKIIFLVPRAPDGSPVGHYYIIYLLAVTKFSDMGAYLVGSLIGRHKFIPHLSPNKTWEGVAGALLFSLGASLAMRALLPAQLPLLTWPDAIGLGLGLGFLAIVGDLGESLIKRSAHLKDSGHFLPGIGGMLDLVDSLLFTAPALFFYLLLLR